MKFSSIHRSNIITWKTFAFFSCHMAVKWLVISTFEQILFKQLPWKSFKHGACFFLHWWYITDINLIVDDSPRFVQWFWYPFLMRNELWYLTKSCNHPNTSKSLIFFVIDGERESRTSRLSKNDNFKRADWTMIEHEQIVSWIEQNSKF